MAEDKPKLLIVEDDPGLQRQLKWSFDDFEVIAADSRSAAVAALRRHEPPVVLQDLGLPPDPEGVSEGFTTLAEILKLAPHTKVIVVTGQLDRDNAVKAVGQGAYDFYQKPVDMDVLRLIVQRALQIHELEARNRELVREQARMPLAGVIAMSESMMRVCRMIEKVAPTNATALLLGESGTGKELLAQALHALSPRAGQSFVAINCAAIPDTLLESELFGYEKGAFTGAIRQTPGKFELADGGTLFLDEIGDMPLPLQAKLLRFLQDRVIERIGGRERIAVDVRIVCATNKDLPALIEGTEFRQDLYYRISEVAILIPPLRERPGDAVVIAQAVMERAQSRARPRIARVLAGGASRPSRPTRGRATSASWKTASMARSSWRKGSTSGPTTSGCPWTRRDLEWLNLRSARQRAESGAIRQALAVASGNLSKAAELLGITRPTLYDLLDKNGITVPERVAEG